MKRLFAAITLALAAAAAFALPAPAQIEDALATQHYADARSMINEVLRERPDSARAHLLNSYVLVHVDHNRAAANAELETAKGLDKRGDVKSSPLFGRVVAEIGATAPAKPAGAKGVSQSDGENAGRVLLIVFGLAALGIGLYLIFRILAGRPDSTRVVFVGGGGGGYSGPAAIATSNPIGPWPGSGGHALAAYPAAAFSPQVAQPMGPLGTAASVAGGVVAGNAISDLLRSSSHSRRDDDWGGRSSESAPSPSPVSYESDRSSLSSSSSRSSDWGSSSSSGSSSSDWGSSSSSSGDSSSSFSSDSSSDW